MNKCLISFFLLLSVFWLCCPLTNAVSMSENLVDNIITLEEKGLLNEGAASRFQSWFPNSYLKYYLDSGYGYCIGITTSTSNQKPDTIAILLSNDKSFGTITNNNNTWNYIFNIYFNNFNWSASTSSTNSGGWQLNNTTWKYFYTPYYSINTTSMSLNVGEEYGGNYIFDSVLSFEPFPEPTKTLNGVTYYIKAISRTVPMWRLGTLSNISQNGTGKCSAFLDEWIGYWHPFYQPPVNNNGNTTVEVYLDNSKVLYNNAYRIRFSDNDNWTDYTYFIFIPYGQTFSGDLFSGDLLYTGFDNNNDIPIISSIDSQYSVNSGEVGLIFDDYFTSGNYLSGDYGIFTEAYNHDLSNSYFDRLYTLYRNILYTLLQQGNVTLDIQYRNYHLTLNSSDFTVPNNALKTMVMTLLIVWTFFLLYQQLDLFIRNIQTLNLFGFLHDTDVDYHMFL